MNAPGAWRNAVLESLTQGGPVCQHAAQYIVENNTEIGFARQSTSARWTLRRNIELNSDLYSPKTTPASPHLLGVVVHEATHLEQGVALALSVEGEVGGWKAEYDARVELNVLVTNPHWKAVARVSEAPTDQALRHARSEMLQMAGYRYLVWLLPLRPNFWTRLVAGFQRVVFRKGKRV